MTSVGSLTSRARLITDRIVELDESYREKYDIDKGSEGALWMARPEETNHPHSYLIPMDEVCSARTVSNMYNAIIRDLSDVVYQYPVNDVDNFYYRFTFKGGVYNVTRMLGAHTKESAERHQKLMNAKQIFEI